MISIRLVSLRVIVVFKISVVSKVSSYVMLVSMISKVSGGMFRFSVSVVSVLLCRCSDCCSSLGI